MALACSLYNNILAPTKLAIGSNYHLFKEGIRPMWEDPINAKGGKWIFTNARSRKARLDECWLNVVRGRLVSHLWTWRQR